MANDNKKQVGDKVLTKEQLMRRINNAVVMVNKTKDYVGVYFDDKGIKLECCDDCAIISTLFHRHVFNMVTSSGISKPYTYISRAIDIALTNDCTIVDAQGNTTRSYAKLFELLEAKQDKTEYNTMWYIDLWLSLITAPLYSIGESIAESFLVYERYLHEMAHTQAMLQGTQGDTSMTNLQYVERVMELEKSFIGGLEEHEIFPKIDKEQIRKENADAMRELEEQAFMAEHANDELKKG